LRTTEARAGTRPSTRELGLEQEKKVIGHDVFALALQKSHHQNVTCTPYLIRMVWFLGEFLVDLSKKIGSEAAGV
jgi:hypothetical protein